MIVRARISGMHCESCAVGIETFVQRQQGIRNAAIDYDEEMLRIEYEEAANLDTIWERIEAMGYDVLVDED